ncbi:MAG: glycosidase [Deltaproteobacteria bacterium]|nr:MAG: glycosidase [Deltaproteobacteria bacterium]
MKAEYQKSIRKALQEASRIGEVDIVIGIPFYDEVDTIGDVIEAVKEGVTASFPDERGLICCVGAPTGNEALKAVEGIPLPARLSRLAFLMQSPLVNGKGWAVRAIMDVANALGSDLILLEADLLNPSYRWLADLLEPIKKAKADLVLPRFSNPWHDTPISDHLIRPLIASFFGFELLGYLSGELAISREFLGTYLGELITWTAEVGRYGVDIWLITRAMTTRANIEEVHLGIRSHKKAPEGKREVIFREQAEVIFDQIHQNRQYWERGLRLRRASVGFGVGKDQGAKEKYKFSDYIIRYRRGFNRFHFLYHEILPEECFRQLEKLAERKDERFNFSSTLWQRIIYEFLLAFCFERKFAKEDIINALLPLYEGRVAGFAEALRDLEEETKDLDPVKRRRLLYLEAQKQLEEQVTEFIKGKKAFLERWDQKERETKPVLPEVTYLEFIPDVPLVLPKELASSTGERVKTEDVYNSILQRYRSEFEHFIYHKLKVPPGASPFEIAESIRAFMDRVERELERSLLRGDLRSIEGTREVVRTIFANFPHGDTFVLRPEVTSWLLAQFPPPNLLVKFGKGTITELEREYEPNDILALSGFSEDIDYIHKIWSWVAENARPEHFCPMDIKSLVVSWEDLPLIAEMKETLALSKISGRVIISNLPKGMGGEFPKLRYLTRIAKNIIELEKFGEIWEEFALKKKEFGSKVVNSLKGHWAREPLSAHNIFENKLQKILAQRLTQMARKFKNKKGLVTLGGFLEDIAESYHLAITFADGTFVPCSAWSWASYSFKGGRGFPTPLSLHVERDWASREFLIELYKKTGGNEDELDERIIELMGQGREWESLAKVLFPQVREAQEVSPVRIPSFEEPEAGRLRRFQNNPILKPIKKHPWESKYVFNPAAIRLKDRIYLLYRAWGKDDVSRIGLAMSSDGFHIEERLDVPIFEPKEGWEANGCEDPRLTLIDGRIYMLYTAYSSLVAQIAMASISVDDFLEGRWGKWERHGLLFPGHSDKDAILFPERFDGRYVLYHRTAPSIWISFSDSLSLPWPRKDHRILVGPRAGMMWDGVKIGAGAPPIKTKYGWLLIYHGVDIDYVYRLGLLLADLKDPGKILYRSPNPILEPQKIYEVGKEGVSQVPNVVFTCGALPRFDKEVLDDDDEIIVYYGAADTVIAAAAAKVSDLIPAEVRKRSPKTCI